LHRSTERYITEYVKTIRSKQHTDEYPSADVIIIDPPRTGCTPPVAKGLLYSQVKHIIYVSCNPITFAHDAQAFEKQYSLKKIVGIDMFPDISHVEIIALFTRKNAGTFQQETAQKTEQETEQETEREIEKEITLDPVQELQETAVTGLKKRRTAKKKTAPVKRT